MFIYEEKYINEEVAAEEKVCQGRFSFLIE